MSSSLPYWEKRWAADPSYAASWPDEYARRLELEYLAKELPRTGRILDLGCGAFGLSESEEVRQLIRGRYYGVDGSVAAIEQAKARADRYGGGWDFMQTSDIEAVVMSRSHLQVDFVMTKRFLQNLTPEARAPLWEQLAKFPHGVLIEDFVPARENTDTERRRLGCQNLDVPEFNWPIHPKEFSPGFYARGQQTGGKVDAFMGYFYAITRVFPNLPRAGFEAAYQLSHEAIRDGRGQPFRGPVVALRW